MNDGQDNTDPKMLLSSPSSLTQTGTPLPDEHSQSADRGEVSQPCDRSQQSSSSPSPPVVSKLPPSAEVEQSPIREHTSEHAGSPSLAKSKTSVQEGKNTRNPYRQVTREQATVSSPNLQDQSPPQPTRSEGRQTRTKKKQTKKRDK